MVEPGLTETPQDSSEVTESTDTQVTPPLPEMGESAMGNNEEQTENSSDEIEPGPVPELDSPERFPRGDTASELRHSSRVVPPFSLYLSLCKLRGRSVVYVVVLYVCHYM